MGKLFRVAAVAALSILSTGPGQLAVTSVALPGAVLAMSDNAEARAVRGRGHAGGAHRGGVRYSGRTTVNRNVVRRTTNVNVRRSRNIDVDVRHRYGYGVGGVAIGAAAGLAVGAAVASIPSGCSTYSTGGVTYRDCNGVWYAPRYYGSNVTYVVVGSPR